MTNVNTSASTASDASTTSADAASNAAPGTVEKKVEAFYSKANATRKASVWVTVKTKPGSPDFDGTIEGVRVAGYLKKGPKAGFISFIDSKIGKGADGHYTQVATANVVVNPFGIPNLVVKAAGKEDLWIECSLRLNQSVLIEAGLNLEILAAKKAAAAAKKAASAAAAATTATAPAAA